MAVKKIILASILFILAFCTLDVIAQSLTTVEEGDATTLKLGQLVQKIPVLHRLQGRGHGFETQRKKELAAD